MNWIAVQVSKEYIASILDFKDYLDDIDNDTDNKLYGRQDGQALGHRDGSSIWYA